MVDIPKDIIAIPDDKVSYSAIISEKNEKTSYKNLNCFASHMPNLPDYTFDCFPCGKKSILSREDFFLWMKFCTFFGFTPPGTIPYIDGEKNCCIIHGANNCRHRIYAGLCCYRWAENLAPMVYETCRLIELRPDINFYRILHYVMGKHVTLIGHSFTNICCQSMSMYVTNNPGRNLMWALMLKYCFDVKINKIEQLPNNQTTQRVMEIEIAKTQLNLSVKKHEDLLDDKWEELFSLPNPSDQQIKDCYNKLI